MSRSPVRKSVALAGLLGAAALILGPGAVAHADPVNSGTAGAFGATITAGGEDVIPPTPSQSIELPPGGEATETVVDIPADPLAVSGTLTADVAAHSASDLDSTLVTEGTAQTVEGPYNARGVGLVENLDVLLDSVDEGVSLLSADVVRAEAVGVCRNGAVEYSATSEIIGLFIGGEEVPINAPVQDIIDGISDVLVESGLNAVVDVQRNVVTVDGDGASVDALVVTVLAAAGEDPLAQVRIAHAEVGGLACGSLPECSDTVDNDGDGIIDFPDDPGCDSAEDDSELDTATVAPGAAPECSDGADNDGDGKIDFPEDPDCTSAEDDSEAGGGSGALPRTGGETALALAAALALGAFGVHRLRSASLS